MVIKDEEDHFVGRIKKLANVNRSSTVDQETLLDSLDIIFERGVEIFLSRDGDQSVKHMVALEQILEDFCGTYPVNITVYQN